MPLKNDITSCFSIVYLPVSSLLHIVLFLVLWIPYGCGDALNSGAMDELPLATIDSVSINEIDLMPSGERIVLSTNNGVFIVEGDRLLQAGMQGETITNLVILDEQTMLLSIPINNIDKNGEIPLFRTTNGGRSWSGFRRNWGGEDRISFVGELAVDPTNRDHLFGRGAANVARSLNGGRSWESVFFKWTTFGSNSSLLKINPDDPDEIWGGGSDAAFFPSLFKSDDGGKNWINLAEKLQIFKDENRRFETPVTSLIIKKGDSDKLLISLCCFFSDIFRSEDGGETWEQSFHESREEFLTLDGKYTFEDLAASPGNPNTVYASGRNNQGSLLYAVTRDFGDTWETIEVPDTPGGISVNDLAVVERGGRDVLLFGTNKGFFRVPVEEN